MDIETIKQFNEMRYSQVFQPETSDRTRIDIYLKLIGSGKKILDIGCWDGYIGQLVKKQNNHVYGVEVVPAAADRAGKILDKVYNLPLVGAWADQINEQFDLILTTEVIEHIFDTDNFLANIKRLLKPGGELVVSTPNAASLGRRLLLLLGRSPNLEITSRIEDSGHIRYFTMSSMKQLLREHGFDILVTTSNIVNFSYSGRVSSRLLSKLWPALGTTLIIKAKLLS